MEYRKLSKSDLNISVLGLGCWAFGGGEYWGEQNQADVNTVVRKSLELGINYFDTAEVYNDGASETSLGLALKGKREKALIGSKVTPANTKASVLRQHCDASLKRLGTDYIDLYMLHWPITSHSIEHFTDDRAAIAHPPSMQEAFATLKALKQQGKIREMGISNHGVKQMDAVLDTTEDIVTNELPYNLLSRGIEESILPYCAQHSLGVIAYMPLQQGLLTGKYNTAGDVKPMQARSRHFSSSHGLGSRHGENGAESEIFQALSQIKIIAAELNVDMTVLCLAWVIANEHISTTIVGSRNEEQLVLNVKGASYKISKEVIEQLSVLTEPVLKKMGNNPDYYENRFNSRIE